MTGDAAHAVSLVAGLGAIRRALISILALPVIGPLLTKALFGPTR